MSRGFISEPAERGGMYAVVGCNACSNLWLVRDLRSSETARCSRCGKTHQTAKLKRLFESDDRDAAREARSALLAEKQGDGEAFAAVDHVSELERAVEDAGVDDQTYLEGAGLDADAVDEAAARSIRRGGASSRSREEIVREAITATDDPTRERIVAYATEHGVPADAARSLLTALTRRGALTKSGGRYRLL